jgi:two-component system, chemotaxis family, chemotaxis protein CheY
MKILIVDDSRAINAMVSEMLQNAGHDSSWAENGADAVSKIKDEGNFDLILLDWNMPVMSGPEFLQENQKNKFTDTPVVMMTTENKPSYIKEALSLGAVEYVMKPFTSDILLNKIDIVLRE